MEKLQICFVCLGNICRSPLADAVMRHQARERGVADRFRVISRGVSGYHRGERADSRMRATASAHGIEIDGVSEEMVAEDYDTSDLILSMDQARHTDLLAAAPSGTFHKVVPFRAFDPMGGPQDDVPDPYYGGSRGFEEVFSIVERSCRVLLDRLLDGSYQDLIVE